MSLTSQYGDYGQIAIGDEVFGADQEKLGNVAEISPQFITVEKGFFFPSDYYVPRSAVQDTADGRVYLNVSRDTALHSGWDQIPEDLDVPVADDRLLQTQAGNYATGSATGTTGAIDQDEIHVPVAEEELTATVRPVEAGAVRVEKRVVSEDQELEVPVTEERIRVERRVVDRPVDAADAAAFEQVDVEVPLHQEAVDVQKQARVKEDIVISKEAVQRSERVKDKVRREEVVIEDETRGEELRP
jgi:uncharacterized protein (TIGR02271 family)